MEALTSDPLCRKERGQTPSSSAEVESAVASFAAEVTAVASWVGSVPWGAYWAIPAAGIPACPGVGSWPCTDGEASHLP